MSQTTSLSRVGVRRITKLAIVTLVLAHDKACAAQHVRGLETDTPSGVANETTVQFRLGEQEARTVVESTIHAGRPGKIPYPVPKGLQDKAGVERHVNVTAASYRPATKEEQLEVEREIEGAGDSAGNGGRRLLTAYCTLHILCKEDSNDPTPPVFATKYTIDFLTTTWKTDQPHIKTIDVPDVDGGVLVNRECMNSALFKRKLYYNRIGGQDCNPWGPVWFFAEKGEYLSMSSTFHYVNLN